MNHCAGKECGAFRVSGVHPVKHQDAPMFGHI